MYNNPTPVVVGLIRCNPEETNLASYKSPQDQASLFLTMKLLAIQRAIPPHIGGYAFPGGYVNEGESAETAIAREVLEETGINLDSSFWRPMLTRVTPDNKLLIFMRSIKVISSEDFARATQYQNPESLSVKLVNEEDELCFPLHQGILKSRILWA